MIEGLDTIVGSNLKITSKTEKKLRDFLEGRTFGYPEGIPIGECYLVASRTPNKGIILKVVKDVETKESVRVNLNGKSKVCKRLITQVGHVASFGTISNLIRIEKARPRTHQVEVNLVRNLLRAMLENSTIIKDNTMETIWLADNLSPLS